ncbi:MAG: hypothetical protein K9L68_06195 [Spirochaetales bacterium]|nr:hypothetical protein [Spirochaetales bacterium]MCF7938172.1 hypothetical protein [Spirochaetales bacterium]
MKETEGIIEQFKQLFSDFEKEAGQEDIRKRVLKLLPAADALRDLGKSLVPQGLRISARDRILRYFQLYPYTVINEREIALVSGISEWARRVRELRVQFGWKIYSGLSVLDMIGEGDVDFDMLQIPVNGPAVSGNFVLKRGGRS